MEALKLTVVRQLACAVALAWSSGAFAADPVAVRQLVQQAQFWEQKQQPDRARESWKRVLAVDPKNVDALGRLSVLEDQAGHAAEARRYEAQLREVAPGAVVKRDSGPAVVVGGRESELARARDLAQQNRTVEAVEHYRKAFGAAGPNSDELALEYYETLSGTRDGWTQARDGLSRLSRSHPDMPRYALAYASTLTYRLESRRDGIDKLKALSTTPGVADPARRAWRQALLWMSPTPADRPRYQAYLQTVGSDAEVEKRMAEAAIARAPVVAVPVAPKVDDQTQTELRAAFAALDGDQIDTAEAGFTGILARKANDADALGGLGVVRLRQGRFAEADQLITRAGRAKPSLAVSYREAQRTAQFWMRVRGAESAVESKDYKQAETLYQSALSAPPGGRAEPSVVRAASEVLVRNGKAKQAEAQLRAALKTAPTDPDLTGGLAALLQNSNRSAEARKLIAGLPPGNQPQLQGVRVDLARQQAAAAVAEGRLPEAEAVLREALVSAPESPWVRLDLARLYHKLGRDADADALLDSLAQAAPEPGSGSLARAYAYAESQRWYETLLALEDLPTALRTAPAQKLQREAWVRYQVQRAQQAAKQGDPSRAAQWLSAAVNGAGDAPELSGVIAQGWAALGDPARAVAVLRRSFSSGVQPGVGDRIQYAALLLQIDQGAEFEAVSTEMIRRGGMTPQQQRTLEDLVVGYRIKLADRAREGGDLAESYRQLREVVARYPAETRVQLALGRLFASAGEPEKAIAIARSQIDQGGGPNEVTDELLYAGIDSALAAHDNENALRWIDAAVKRGTDPVAAHKAAARLAESRGRKADALRHYRAAEAQAQPTRRGPPLLTMIDPATGRGQSIPDPVNELLGPDDAPVGPLLPRALGPEPRPLPEGIAAAQKSDDRAGGFRLDRGIAASSDRASAGAPGPAAGEPLSLRLSRSVSRDPDSDAWIAEFDPQALGPSDRLEAAVSGWTLGALMSRSRQGEGGLTKLLDLEFGADWVSPEWSLGRLGLRVRPVTLDGGTVSGANLLRFGSLALIRGDAANQKQSDNGVALALAYQLGSVVLDVGTTPLGFAVENAVGGLRWSPQFGQHSFTLDIARRAINDSLLSYAGTYDPLTGVNWGGVTRNGGRLDYSYDLGGYGIYLNGGYYALAGRNVDDNSEVEAGGGFFARLYKTQRQTVTAGLNLTTFFYDKNLRYFTLGHGGYFSPQSFGALTVPVSWVYGRGPLALRADVAIGTQSFREDGAPLFPGRQALQDELGRLAASEPEANLPQGYGNQSVSGLSYKVAGAAQYRLSGRLSAGGSLSLDNARDYEEFALTAYVRYYFSGVQGLATEPNPPQFFGAPLP